MLKNRILRAAGLAALLLVLVPVPSQAVPWTWAQLPVPAPGIFSQVERWWIRLLSAPEPPADRQKNGCGMDPNGKPLRDPGDGQGMAPADPADSGLK